MVKIVVLSDYRRARTILAPLRLWLAWCELGHEMMRRAWGLK